MLVVVGFPNLVEEVGDDGAVLFRTLELHPFAKAKVGDVVRHCSDVVHRDVLLAHFTAV